MKRIKTEEAAGHVLCHDMTRIIPGVEKGAAFRKGHIVTEEDIPALLSMGKEQLYVWEKEEGMLHENEGAERLCELCLGPNMERSEVKEGRINLTAQRDGLFKADKRRIDEINGMGELLIASRHGNVPVKKGDLLAATRVVPLVIAEEKLAAAKAAAWKSGEKPLFSVLPFRLRKAGIIATGSEVQKGRIADTFTPVIQKKLAEYGVSAVGPVYPGDDADCITGEILKLIERERAELVICTGGMSVDPDDRTPLAIRNTKARIVTYGAPVLPGAMFMLAYYQENIPVLGLPGCVMYAERTVFDLALPRLLADDPISREDITGLGVGGLCLGCPVCAFPACGFGKGGG